jgi:hypothetical protein
VRYWFGFVFAPGRFVWMNCAVNLPSGEAACNGFAFIGTDFKLY